MILLFTAGCVRKGEIMMQIFSGKSVFGGIAIGNISIVNKDKNQVKREKITDASEELEKFYSAKEKAKKQLSDLYDKALVEVGEAHAAIFEIHQMMLDDDDYVESIENIIKTQLVNAEYAIAVTGDNFAKMFGDMEDEYMRERAADIKDITERLLNVLSDKGSKDEGCKDKSIIIAEDLTPSQTVQMDKSKVISFVTSKGSINSHTAILARTMGIPALVSTEMEIDSNFEGSIAVVDGYEGKIYINPTDEVLNKKEQLLAKELEKKQLLEQLKGKETVTGSGRKINLYANIGDLKDLALVLENDAEGIGLFRSEFIYLGKKDFPTEEEQYRIYKTIAETMAEKAVIIRTLDIGADKQCDYFNLDHEENPALGYRAIRICLTDTEIFKTQLRALFRAAYCGNIMVMFPMITSVEEVLQIKEIVKCVVDDLEEQKMAYRIPKQGIMIETPAAALCSDELAKLVDFFSIGTNDLSQYTLAIDRQNTKLDKFYNAHHPAILKMIKCVIENAHKAGIWAGICGELGADLSLTETFVQMGVDELSVSPGSILMLRDKICKIK